MTKRVVSYDGQDNPYVENVPSATELTSEVTAVANPLVTAAIAAHALLPHGGAHPDLATHDALGLATQSELNAVAAAKSDTGHTHQETWTTVKALNDESKNSLATVADDNTLVAALTANTSYALYLNVFFLTNATADLKYRLVFTGTTTRVRRRVSRSATADTPATTELKTAFDAADVVLSTTGLNPWLEEDVILQVGASGGNFKLQWSQGTSNAGPTTRLEGSYLMYMTT